MSPPKNQTFYFISSLFFSCTRPKPSDHCCWSQSVTLWVWIGGGGWGGVKTMTAAPAEDENMWLTLFNIFYTLFHTDTFFSHLNHNWVFFFFCGLLWLPGEKAHLSSDATKQQNTGLLQINSSESTDSPSLPSTEKWKKTRGRRKTHQLKEQPVLLVSSKNSSESSVM